MRARDLSNRLLTKTMVCMVEEEERILENDWGWEAGGPTGRDTTGSHLLLPNRIHSRVERLRFQGL